MLAEKKTIDRSSIIIDEAFGKLNSVINNKKVFVIFAMSNWSLYIDGHNSVIECNNKSR